MNLGITGLMNNYSIGGIYPWNSLSYTGGLYPLTTSYRNGLNGFGVGFSDILNKAYHTEGKAYSIEVDEKGQISKITMKDTGEQVAVSSKQEVSGVSERKVKQTQQQEVHWHQLGGCCKRRSL